MHPLETYLHDLAEIHVSGAGVPETSGYPILRALLDETGKTLKPKVRCIIHLRNQGAGIPDAGLFTADQLRGLPDEAEALTGQLPARAVLEVKDPAYSLDTLAESAQARKYLDKYGLILLTNYRAFLLVQAGPGGKPVKLEGYRLAEDEKAFWKLAAHPRRAATAHGERLADYLRRAMLMKAPLSTPADVAWFLASYAREALARIAAAQLPALGGLRAALEQTLGLAFEGEKGDHFFHSTLVQTLFYGVFSAWVLWHEEDRARADRFRWHDADRYLRVPVITALFEQVNDYSKLRALDVVELLDWAEQTLNRVNRAAFFTAFEKGHAVQYFYEPFLQAFDPQLRKDLGVWYTPPEIVQYMVARVDRVLREELGIADGLADPDVLVLDPCAGTGAYLVEALRRIAATLAERGEGALLGDAVQKAARERVFGFEILPAPYVVAHLQLGLLLQELGAPLAEGARAGMYLTNALTGWNPPDPDAPKLPFHELVEEQEAADGVKRHAPILVVIGNPPYNGFAGVSPTEEGGLVEPYKQGLISEWGIKKFNLDDLYVRFFRLAERRIAEQTGRGVVCYISNYSYLSDPSFVVMRRRFLREFDALWFDCLNGDSRETGKLTPEGLPDPSVFSTEANRAGIRVGTAIGLMVRKADRATKPAVAFRQFWGVTKRADLLASLDAPDFEAHYQPAAPEKNNRFSFRPSEITSDYLSWPDCTQLAEFQPSLGILENRRDALVSIDKEPLIRRMSLYYDPATSWEELSRLETGLTRDAARFDARKTRSKILETEEYHESTIRRLMVRPMDSRWCFYTSVRPLWNEPRPAYVEQCWKDNGMVVTRRRGVANPEGTPFFYTRMIGAQHGLTTDAYYVPVALKTESAPTSPGQISMPGFSQQSRANLSPAARACLAALGLPDPDEDTETAALIWLHALAIGYAPAYLRENADGVRQDWPRIPLPVTADRLRASAALGAQLAALLDTETPLPGVTAGAIRPELREIAVLAGPAPPNLTVTAGWGNAGRGGITMPGKGTRSERAPTAAERVPGLGETTHDLYLNDASYWRNVPARVWDYTIGGYQVIKKWLSYREAKLLGRAITADEAREVRDMARRIAVIALLEPALDANYVAVKAAPYAWPGT